MSCSIASLVLTTLVAVLPLRVHALTIVSDPTFTRADNAPLSGLLQVATDMDSTVSISVNDGVEVWERAFHDFGTTHSLPLYGFKPGRTNQITITVRDRARNEATAAHALEFITDPLPYDFPNLTVRQTDPSKMEPGYTLFRVGVHNNSYWYVVIVDHSGEVVWYDDTPSTADVRQLPNGNLFMPGTNSFVELNLLGDTVNSWNAPLDLPIDPHDGVPTDHGTILYLATLTESVTNYPTSVTVPNAPTADASIFYQNVIELSTTNATVLGNWSTIDVLDPRRVTYLVGSNPLGWDAQHSNAVIEDPSDQSFIVSLRHQNAVVKISRATGQLQWILGPPEGWGPQWQPYLLKPVGTPFAWQYGQHAPLLTPQGTLMLYDDGDFRATPFDPPVADTNNYSRALEYKINEQTMEVSQVWDYGRTNMAERLYTPYEGSADPLPKTGNVLIGFPAVTYVNGVPPSSFGPSATMARIKEVTHEAVPEVVFDLGITLFDKEGAPFRDCSIYRCHRIPDLYGHPPVAVSDLSVTYQSGIPSLEFSADEFRAYHIQASANMVNWEDLGAPLEDPESPGLFSFTDQSADPGSVRFYRVVTE